MPITARFRDCWSDKGGQLGCQAPHQALGWTELSGKSVATVFDVEIVGVFQDHGRAPRWFAAALGKAQGRALAQENAADLEIGLASNPEPIAVAADEKQRNGFAENAGIRALRPIRRRQGLGRRRLRRINHC